MAQPLAPKTPDLPFRFWGFICGVGLGSRGCVSRCGGCLGSWVKVWRSLGGHRPGVRLESEVFSFDLSFVILLCRRRNSTRHEMSKCVVPPHGQFAH